MLLDEKLRRGSVGLARGGKSRKGTNGVRTNGVTADFMFFFDRGTFCFLLLTYLYIPKSTRAYLFPQSDKMHYFCSGPVGVDPICPHPRGIVLLLLYNCYWEIHTECIIIGMIMMMVIIIIIIVIIIIIIIIIINIIIIIISSSSSSSSSMCSIIIVIIPGQHAETC